MAKPYFSVAERLSQQADYTSKLIKANCRDTVLLDTLNRSISGMDKTNDYVRKTELEADESADAVSVAEGLDHDGTFEVDDNDIAQSVLENVRTKGWRMTAESIRLKGGRINMDDQVHLIARDGRKLTLGIERLLGSDRECVDRVSSATVTKTRGLMSWLSPGAHTVLDFNARHRPACEIKGNVDITEAQIEKALQEAHDKSGHMLHLTGFVGLGLKTTMARFLRAVPVTANVGQTLQRTLSSDAKGISNTVDFFEYEAGRITLMLCDSLMSDAALKPVAVVSTNSGAFIELDKFGVEFGVPIVHEDLTPKEDTGGGPRGYHHAMFRLNCVGASGSFRVLRVTP